MGAAIAGMGRWWSSERRTVLKKFRSGERCDTSAAAATVAAAVAAPRAGEGPLWGTPGIPLVELRD